MLMRSVFTIVLSLMFPIAGSAADVTVVGTVTSIEAGRIQIRTDAGQTTSVTLTASTKYVKWITAKPWQQDRRADAQFVKVGKRVRIELIPDSSTTARVVWIVTR